MPALENQQLEHQIFFFNQKSQRSHKFGSPRGFFPALPEEQSRDPLAQPHATHRCRHRSGGSSPSRRRGRTPRPCTSPCPHRPCHPGRSPGEGTRCCSLRVGATTAGLEQRAEHLGVREKRGKKERKNEIQIHARENSNSFLLAFSNSGIGALW